MSIFTILLKQTHYKSDKIQRQLRQIWKILKNSNKKSILLQFNKNYNKCIKYYNQLTQNRSKNTKK